MRTSNEQTFPKLGHGVRTKGTVHKCFFLYFRELEREEKKLEGEIKKAAKMGNKQVILIKNENNHIDWLDLFKSEAPL